MSKPPIYHPIYELSEGELQEWLKYSKDFLSAVDETVELIPYSSLILLSRGYSGFCSWTARSAAYDICVLAESLLTNDRHHFSRSMEASRRLLLENTIDYFYNF